MKKAILLFILLFFLGPIIGLSQGQEEQPPAKKAKVIAEKAEIYLEPSRYSVVIDTISRGTEVTLFQTGQPQKKWLYITYYSKIRMARVTGFVDLHKVEIIQEKPDPHREKATHEKDIFEAETETQSEAKNKPPEKKEAPTPKKKTKEPANQEEILPGMSKELSELEKTLNELEQESTANTEKAKQETTLEKGTKKEEKEQKPEGLKEEKDPTKLIKISADQETKKQEPEKTAEEMKAKETPLKINRADHQRGKTEFTEKNKEELFGEKAQESESAERKEKDGIKLPSKISIKVRKANIRLMPSLKSSIIHQLDFGVELVPLAKSGDWYRVNLPPNPEGLTLSGYIHHSIVNDIYPKPVLTPPEPKALPVEEPEVQKNAAEEREPVTEQSQVIPSSVRAPKPKTGFSVWFGGGAGYTMPSEDIFDKGIHFGGTVGFGITKNLAVEFRVPYFQTDVTGTLEGLSTGRLRAVPLTLSIQARYPLKNRLVPYLVGGGDYYLNTYYLDRAIINSWNDLGFDIEETVNSSFGFHVGAGLDVFLVKNIALNVDLRYSSASLEGRWNMADQESSAVTSGAIEGVKLNSIQAGLSIKFFLHR